MLTATPISRAPGSNNRELDHDVVAGTFTAAPTVVANGFGIRRAAGSAYDVYEFTYRYDATADATTDGGVRPWFWLPNPDPGGAGGHWLAGKIMEQLTIPTASSDIHGPVRRINSVPVGATRMYLQVAAIVGTAPAHLYMVAYGVEGYVACVAGTDIEVDVEFSGSIGAVKIEDATTLDRAKVRDGDGATAVDDHVLVVQDQDPTGAISPAGEINTNAPFAMLTDGAEDLGFERADAVPTIATIVTPTKVVDAAGKQQLAGADSTSALYMRLLGMMGSMGGDGMYCSPIHFTALQNAATKIDLAGGFPVIVDVSQILLVVQISNVGVMTVHYPHSAAFVWDAANSRITVTGATFAGTDIFGVVIRGPDRYANDPGNFKLVGEVNPYPLRSDDVGVELITVAQTLTVLMADVGPEIATFGFNVLKLFLTININNSNDVQVRILDKHTSAGAEEYSPVIEVVGATDIGIEPAYWEATTDTDQLLTVVYQLDGVTPYVQVQARVAVLGAPAADLDAAYYVRGWR